MRLWVLRWQLHVEAPGALGVAVRPGYIVDRDLIPWLALYHRGRPVIGKLWAFKGGVLA